MKFERMEMLRKEHGYTQVQIADMLGINRQVYRRYETGERTIPVTILIVLANIYKVTTDHILGLDK